MWVLPPAETIIRPSGALDIGILGPKWAEDGLRLLVLVRAATVTWVDGRVAAAVTGRVLLR